ncbi:hypothetical protein PR202_gb29303 [Eleusine coracana subsp. coracana]|uniref:Uncharacterized protein n=1 Tax=Eleusine coracana subsp. coracana TaxID=191504 RepID=A0AAV5FZ24_ELECO|nr:hypothetical protein PR202_gb29303 [Eleusine coracana subsp. coracana]
MMGRPTPESGCSSTTWRFSRLQLIPTYWLTTLWSAWIQPFGYGSHLFRRSQSRLGETSTRSS